MKSQVIWQGSMAFEGLADGHRVGMDAKPPIGKGGAPTPKDLVAFGLGGCTAMDVIALLKKYKQVPDSFFVEIEITPSEGKSPAVFEAAVLAFIVQGRIDPDKLLEAVRLSQSKYCGVSAMLSKSFPIRFRVELNGIEIGTGEANFSK